MKRLGVYWIIWRTIAAYTLAETFVSRWTSGLFLLGKSIRFGMSLLFLFLLHQNISHFAGYTTDQMIVFFLTYQLIDSLSQVLFRGVYIFSQQVKSGELDFYLSKPINPLFRILTGKPDFLDAVFLPPTTLISIWIILGLNLHITPASIAAYFLLLLNSMLIATGFHILVICLGVVTTEVDNAIMLYRDIMTLARFPIDIYQEPLRSMFFLLIPVGLMITIPAQLLLNLSLSRTLLYTTVVGLGFFLLSLRTWAWSLKKYTSAGG